MKINIQSLDFTARQSLLNLITDKLGKLIHVSDRIQVSNVVLRLDKSDSRENKVCEIHLFIPGKELYASKVGKTFEEAVGLTFPALERQLVDWKSRLVSHHNGSIQA